MVGHRVVVNITDTPFLGADTAGKVTEVINGKRNVRVSGFADWFAIVHRFCQSQKLQILFHSIRNLL
jgi:hypothetical protein